jgi:glycosyltransferase involved in cell wall biosynthesis
MGVIDSQNSELAAAKHLVVIPAFNEEGSLASTLCGLGQLPECYEVLVVNDGSVDGTGEVAEKMVRENPCRMHVVHLALNCGIGGAVQTGYLFAAKRGGYHFVIQCDADGQHDPAFIPALVEQCRKRNLDLCVGSRFLGLPGDGYQSTVWRRAGIRFFVWLIGRLSGLRLTDPTSGFRCIGPRVWQRFARYYPEDYPEPETLFWCARNHLRVGEIPVRMRPRSAGVSSIRFWKTVYYMAKVSLAILVDRLRAKNH